MIRHDAEYRKCLENRLVSQHIGYYRLFSDNNSEFVTEPEISTLEDIGYELIAIGSIDNAPYALFKKKVIE